MKTMRRSRAGGKWREGAGAIRLSFSFLFLPIFLSGQGDPLPHRFAKFIDRKPATFTLD
jgi:hypothetical protein